MELCHYHGKVRGLPGSWAALSTCNGEVRGVLFDGEEMHHVEKGEDEDDSVHYLYRHNDHRLLSDAVNIGNNRAKRSVSNEKDRGQFLLGSPSDDDEV